MTTTNYKFFEINENTLEEIEKIINDNKYNIFKIYVNYNYIEDDEIYNTEVEHTYNLIDTLRIYKEEDDIVGDIEITIRRINKETIVVTIENEEEEEE